MVKVLTIGCLFLLALTTTRLNASTIVSDPDSSELHKIRASTQKIFKTTCSAAIVKTGFGYSIDLKSCLPAAIADQLLAERSSLGGPNCHNFSLNILGFNQFLYMTMGKELTDLYLSSESSFCRNINKEDGIQAGDWITIGGPEPGHSFIYLTEKYAFNKHGPSLANKWEITTNEDILTAWTASSSWDNDLISVYRCDPKKVVTPSNSLSTIAHIQRFNRALREFQLHQDYDKNSIEKLKQSVFNLSHNLTDDRLFVLSQNLDNPNVRMHVHGLVGLFYPIQKLHNYLDFYQDYANPELAKLFEPAVTVYLETLERLLEIIPPENLDFADIVAGFESARDHCARSSAISNMCRVVKQKWHRY